MISFFTRNFQKKKKKKRKKIYRDLAFWDYRHAIYPHWSSVLYYHVWIQFCVNITSHESYTLLGHSIEHKSASFQMSLLIYGMFEFCNYYHIPLTFAEQKLHISAGKSWDEIFCPHSTLFQILLEVWPVQPAFDMTGVMTYNLWILNRIVSCSWHFSQLNHQILVVSGSFAH